MPIYDYRCQECGQVTEILHRGPGSEEPISCSKCGSTRLERLLSAPAVFIRGDSLTKGRTCCGREERCDTPPCSDDGLCRRDR